MNGNSMHWVNRLAALGLVVGLVAGLAAVGNAQSVGGQAYSTYVNTPLGYSGQSPLAVLPAVSGTDGGMADAEGSATNLAIAGVGSLSGDSPIAPNMNISLPGVGYVVLNEQIPSGDGVSSTGLTVNMIHVYLQNLVGGILNPLTGQIIGGSLQTTGEIIVGSATSTVQ